MVRVHGGKNNVKLEEKKKSDFISTVRIKPINHHHYHKESDAIIPSSQTKPSPH